MRTDIKNRSRLAGFIAGCVMIMAMPLASRGGLTGLYTNDFYTLHLWHLQDTSGTIPYVGTNSVYEFDYATNPLVVPLLLSNMPGVNGNGGVTNTQFSLAGRPGPGAGPLFSTTNYGYALSIMETQYSCYYAPWVASAGGIYPASSYAYPNNACSFDNTNTGAFTWEALIQPQFNPLTFTADKNPEILAMDGPNNGTSPYTERAVQFRFDNATPSSGQAELEFNNISFNGASASHDMYALLPTTGPDAVVQGQWYHVAVAYTGNAPTNGDPPHTMTFYWTLFDPTRTNADVLTNFPYAFTLTNATSHVVSTFPYPSNSIVGSSVFAVGGAGRNAPGLSADGSGFIGNMAEVRISDCYRHSNEFMFYPLPVFAVPVIIVEVPTNVLVGYGQTLTLPMLVSGTQPITFQWDQNGLPLAGQTNETLVISNVTFAANGVYQLFATNAYGSASNALITVTVGAGFQGLFNTGCDANNNPLDQTAPGSVDLHWLLTTNPDTASTIPNAIVWGDQAPVEPYGVMPQNGASVWIGPEENSGNVSGPYTYQTTFQVDETVISNAMLYGTLGASGPAAESTVQAFLNGVETDLTLGSNPSEDISFFTITNGLQPGSNTLVFTMTCGTGGTGGANGFNVNINGIGQSLPPGLPVIINQPVNIITNHDATVSFSFVAVGRPPLSYQWYCDGVAISPATNATAASPCLTFNTPDSGSLGTNYQAVVSNGSGSVTSSVASLTITPGGPTTSGGSISFSGSQACLIQVFDGSNLASSGYAYAGSSDINACSIIAQELLTVSNQQFFVYYGQHQTDPNYPYNSTVWVARRSLGTNIWQVFRTTFVPDDITDGHDDAVFGIDGNGYMHLCWGMHAQPFHYARSTTPVTGNQPIAFGPDLGTMTGNESSVTYPQFFSLPNGDLLFFYRVGVSGNGNDWLNRWSVASQVWTNVNLSNGVAIPFIKGTWATPYNGYWNMPCFDAQGNLYLTWTWRSSGATYESNHDIDFGWSTNDGVTWLRSGGLPYDLPISEYGESGDTNTTAEQVVTIPEDYSLINQYGMCLDLSNTPVVASWWSPGTPTNDDRQYMATFPDATGVWQVRQLSFRTNDSPNVLPGDANVRDLGRPIAVCDKQGRIIVLYRDNFGFNGLTIVHTLPYAMDPERTNWFSFDLTTNNLGNYEPVIDIARWQADNVLDIVYQASSGEGYTPPANNASLMGVLEWNEPAYFNTPPTIQLALTNSNRDIALSWNSRPGWDYQVQWSTNLVNWNAIATLNGISGWQPLQYVQTNGAAGPERFWRLVTQEGGF
jgi:hypothetical protein